MTEREAHEQFEILYKSAQGKSLEVLLKEIFAHPAIFSFSEYADWPKIKDYLASDEGKGYGRLMEIFSYGTYKDLISWPERKSVGELNQKLATKLRQLNMLSIFERDRVHLFD